MFRARQARFGFIHELHMTVSVLDFKDWRDFLKTRLRAMPRKGRGEVKRIAQQIRIDASYLSRILNGEKELQPEHAVLIAAYLGLHGLETDYFVELARAANAGNVELKKHSLSRLEAIQISAGRAPPRPKHVAGLSEADEARFFSNWHYDAFRIAAGVPGLQSVDAIAARFSLPLSLVTQIVDFLVQTGLCVEAKGEIRVGPKHLEINSRSHMIDRHLLNWRTRSVECLPKVAPGDYFYSHPMAVDAQTEAQVRARIEELVSELAPLAKNAKPEALRCFNVDWFGIVARG